MPETRIIRFLCVFAITGCTMATAAANETVIIKADRVDTVSAGHIENGIIVVKDGRISAIGADIEVPVNAKVIDVSDKIVFPGIVSPLSCIGLSPAPGGGPSSTAHYRVADELYPHQDSYDRLIRAGITTLNLVPGGGGPGAFVRPSMYPSNYARGPIGVIGQAALVCPIGDNPEDMLLGPKGPLIIGFQADERTKKTIKGALESAKNKVNSTDPKVRPIADALQGRIPTFISCSGPGDIVHLLPLIEPYKQLKPVLVTGMQEHRVIEQLQRKKIPLILPAQTDYEAFTRNRINIPRLLTEAKIKIALTPMRDSVAGYEDFLRQVGELVKYGLDEKIARKAITLHPAEMLGLDYRVGSLDVGKDANCIVLSGEPFAAGTMIDHVMIQGSIVYSSP